MIFNFICTKFNKKTDLKSTTYRILHTTILNFKSNKILGKSIKFNENISLKFYKKVK